MSLNEQICRIKTGSQAGNHVKLTRRDDILSLIQGQDRNIICFAALFLQHGSIHPPRLRSSALSFKRILSDWCNCAVTGAISHPHQSLPWRYGLLPNMNTPTLLPSFPPWSASMFYGYSDKQQHSQRSAPFARAWIFWPASYHGRTRNSVQPVIYWPCWVRDRFFLMLPLCTALKHSHHVVCLLRALWATI